jgi:hypothetical protein
MRGKVYWFTAFEVPAYHKLAPLLSGLCGTAYHHREHIVEHTFTCSGWEENRERKRPRSCNPI